MHKYIPQHLGGTPRPKSHSGKSVSAALRLKVVELQLQVVDIEAELKAAHADTHTWLACLRSLEDSIDPVRACRVSGMVSPSLGKYL